MGAAKSKSKSNKTINTNNNSKTKSTPGTKYEIYKPNIVKSMNNKPKRNNLKDINIELLVFGYAHINEQTLSPPLNIIPLSIIQIFMKYYCIEGDLIIFLAVSQKHNNYQRFNKYKYIDFINNRTVTLTYHNVPSNPGKNNSSIFAENIPIPSYLYSTQTKINIDDDSKDSLFFDTESKYSAIIQNGTDITYINNNEMNNLSKSESDTLKGYKAKIPNCYPSKLNPSYLYSPNNGLICFDTQEIKQLKFDSNEKWKWKPLAKTQVAHSNGSLCWIRGYSFSSNDADSNEKIFICGGKSVSSSSYYSAHSYSSNSSQCELFDIKNNKLISLQNMPNARSDAGCYFDKLNKNVYVGGGGSGSTYSVDCYDFNKNYWYSLRNTSFPHNNNPMLYMNGYILYIVGNGAKIGSIEMYDTRDSSGFWIFARDLQIDSMLSNDPCTIYKIMSNKSN